MAKLYAEIINERGSSVHKIGQRSIDAILAYGSGSTEGHKWVGVLRVTLNADGSYRIRKEGSLKDLDDPTDLSQTMGSDL